MALIDLILHIFVEVQANDLASMSLHPSALPISFPFFSQLDHSKSLFHSCLEEEQEFCEEIPKEEDPKHLTVCFLNAISICMRVQ